MFSYTVGVIICSLTTGWLIEDWIIMGWQPVFIVYIICILLGFVLMLTKLLQKGGH